MCITELFGSIIDFFSLVFVLSELSCCPCGTGLEGYAFVRAFKVFTDCICSFHGDSSIFDESCGKCAIDHCQRQFHKHLLWYFHCTCLFDHRSYYLACVLRFYGSFCLSYGEPERCQVPSVMSVAIPYHRSDYQHFDACRMHLQHNTTRSKHYLHYIYFICYRMLFFIRSTGQVCNSFIDLLNVEHLISQIKKKSFRWNFIDNFNASLCINMILENSRKSYCECFNIYRMMNFSFQICFNMGLVYDNQYLD